MKKPSFFERLTGAITTDDELDDQEELAVPDQKDTWGNDDAESAQLAVDVFQTPSDIIIKTMVAGVAPDELDVTITREMVTITGTRQEAHEVNHDNYFHKELYWGSFTRTILLPEEIEVEDAQAEIKHGLLTIRLPKIDKEKQSKLRVKSV